MKFKLLFYPLTFLLLLSPFQVYAESSVWKIEKNGNSIFLAGSIHILTPNDYPLPGAFERAYSQSVRVVFETDIQKLGSPEFQQTMLRKLSYSDGRDLQQVVSEDTYESLKTFFESRGVEFADIVNFKPGMVAMLMTIVELQRLGVVGTGVDAYFSEKALSDQKLLGQLETVEDQLEFIANMGIGQEDEMLRYSLSDVERLPRMWKSMMEAWRNGNMPKLQEVAATPLINEFPSMYQSLVIERNEVWMPQIEHMLKTKEIEFVLVGALHLVGSHGLLAKLDAKGYEIEQLQ